MSGQSKEKLYKQYEDSVIAELCETEMNKRYREYCTFSGLYKDDKYKERLLATFDKFDNLPTEYKQQFMDEYLGLELSMDQLKK